MVANVRTDIASNQQKNESGHVNVCGANHFGRSNAKIMKKFAGTP